MFEVGERVRIKNPVGSWDTGVVEKGRGDFRLVRLDSGFGTIRNISLLEPEKNHDPIRSSTRRRLEAWKERGGVL